MRSRTPCRGFLAVFAARNDSSLCHSERSEESPDSHQRRRREQRTIFVGERTRGDAAIGGDYEWWLRLAAAGERFVHVAEPLGVYLASDTSVEHRDPSLLWRESEAARERHWRAEWGPRPRPHGVYLRFDLASVARHTLRGDFAPLRDAVAHARMLVRARMGR